MQTPTGMHAGMREGMADWCLILHVELLRICLDAEADQGLLSSRDGLVLAQARQQELAFLQAMREHDEALERDEGDRREAVRRKERDALHILDQQVRCSCRSANHSS